MQKPFIVGIGGSPKPQSKTEQALKVALGSAEAAGARTRLFGGADLATLPLYLTEGSAQAGAPLIEAVPPME